jgi:3-keto-L-gulonate-6-phosphate decarboxylase
MTSFLGRAPSLMVYRWVKELEGAGEEVLDSIDTRFAGLEVAVAGGLCEKELQQCLNQTEVRRCLLVFGELYQRLANHRTGAV